MGCLQSGENVDMVSGATNRTCNGAKVTCNAADISMEFFLPRLSNDPAAAFRAKNNVVVKTYVGRGHGANPRTLSGCGPSLSCAYQGLRSFYSLNPCYVEIVKCGFSVQGLFPSKNGEEPLAPSLLPGSRSFPHPFRRTQTRSSIESNDNLLFDAQDQPETPVLHFSLRPDQTGYRT